MRFLLVALCTALLTLSAAVSASAAKPFTLAIQDDPVFTNGNPTMKPAQGLDAIKKIHVKAVRLNIRWSEVLVSKPTAKKAPKTPKYNLKKYDTAIAAIRARGNKVDLTITGAAPAWATGSHKVGGYKISPTQFGRFAKAMAAHFKTKVASISIWNEPNFPSWIAPFKKCTKVKGKRKKVCVDQRPALYRAMYLKAYAGIKSVSRKIPVWIGELSPQGRPTSKGTALAPLAFMRGVLCVDPKVTKHTCSGMLKTDGLAVHPYLLGEAPTKKPAGRDDISMAVLSRASNLLIRAEKAKAVRLSTGKTGIPIYLTEFGYLTNKVSRGATLSEQAKWVPQAATIARKAARVRQLTMYQLIDPGGTDTTVWRSGLYKSNKSAKPVVAKLVKLNLK